jgi:hypothetical protein
MLALVATFGLMVTGCSSGSGGGTGTDTPTSTPAVDTVATYSAGSGTTAAVLTITAASASERAYTPKSGDRYVLTYNAAVISSGTIAVAGATITFTSATGKTFTATVSGTTVTFAAAVPKEGGGTQTLPPVDTRVVLTAGTAVGLAAAATTTTVTFTGATGLSLGIADFAVSTGGTITGVSVNGGTVTVSVTFAANAVATIKTYTVSAASGSTTIKSSTTVIITQAAVLPALSGTVSISGTATVGQMLTAVTASLGGSGAITYQWIRGSTNVGTNSATYVPVTADVGQTIKVEVRRAGYSDTITSAVTATVTLPTLTGTVSISGTAKVGQTLTAVTSGLTSPQGSPTYQWKRAGSTNLGTGATYVPVTADVGSTLTVTVTYSGNSGSVISGATATVAATDSVTVNFNGLPQDETIGLTVPTATLSWVANTTLTVTVGGTFSAYEWYVDGVVLSGQTGTSVTLNARDYALGGHTVSVRVTTAGARRMQRPRILRLHNKE